MPIPPSMIDPSNKALPQQVSCHWCAPATGDSLSKVLIFMLVSDALFLKLNISLMN